MADVDRLLAEYKEAQRGGEGDPRPFLDRASNASEREVLSALIDTYLEQAPRREYSREAFRASPAANVAEAVERSLAGSAGMWPALLPRLRTQARIKRADLVRELAARLGAESQQEKVGSYYHEMEQGLLPADGVSDTVLEALGKIVGVAADSLRKAGAMPAPRPARQDEMALYYARTTLSQKDFDAEAPPAARGEAPDFDEVDRLFLGDRASAEHPFR